MFWPSNVYRDYIQHNVNIQPTFLNLPFRANFYPMTGLSQTDDLLTDLGEGRLGGPLERPTDLLTDTMIFDRSTD